MNILIFSLTYFPYVGGAEVAVKEIANRIGDMEFDLVCARLDKKLPKQEKIGNVNVYRVGWGNKLDKYLYPILANLKAGKLHKKRNYQIVQAIMAMWGGIAALFFKCLNPKVKYLLTMQSGDTDKFIRRRTWFWAPVYAQIYREADYVQAISHYLARRARQFGYKGEIEVIPNGVNIERFSRQHDVKKDKNTIITVSRLVEKNGVEDLIKAMALISPFGKGSYVAKGYADGAGQGYCHCEEGTPDAAISNIKLVIIGSGKEEKKLKKLAEGINLSSQRKLGSSKKESGFQLKAGMTSNITFLGSINHEDLPKHLQSAGIFVRPSLSEGLGNAFLEAMLCGLPIIGTPVGGIVDFLKDEEIGLFCQPKNPRSIAENVSNLLSNKELYNRLVQNGQKLVREKYDWKIIAKDMEDVYKKIIK